MLFDSCKTSLDLFDMLNNMRSYDDSTYAHSLNVALICRRFGKWLKVSPDVLDTITLCGLLHDICKANFYAVEMRNRKNDQGRWEQYPFYVVDDKLPYGHGEKSTSSLGLCA